MHKRVKREAQSCREVCTSFNLFLVRRGYDNSWATTADFIASTGGTEEQVNNLGIARRAWTAAGLFTEARTSSTYNLTCIQLIHSFLPLDVQYLMAKAWREMVNADRCANM